MSLNLLFFSGAVVSGSVLTVLLVVYHRMKRKKSSLDGFEKSDVEVKPNHEDTTMPEAADYSPPKPEAEQVAKSSEPETKKTFLAIMIRLSES